MSKGIKACATTDDDAMNIVHIVHKPYCMND